MVRSTTLYIVALSISAVLAGSTNQPHRLSARRRHLARSNSSTTTKKAAHCAATGTSSASSASSTSSSNSTTSGDDSTGSGDGSGDDSTGSSDNSTSTSTASSSNSTGAASSGSSIGSTDVALGVLPPNGTVIAGWTTAQLPQAVDNVQYFKLEDNTFIETGNMGALPHPIITQDGDQVMDIHFDKGAYDLKTTAGIIGGFSFYTSGPAKGGSGSTPAVDMAALKAREVSFGYGIKFTSGFQFNKGGKLPGLFGGTSYNVAATCSGGAHAAGCFSTRLMFRPNGQGELYLYIPPDSNRVDLCGADGTSSCRAASSNGLTYGASVGTGNFMFKSGEWMSVREVIHLNTPGQKDGWAAVYVNGATAPSIYIDQLVFGTASDTYFWGQQMQSFFGGHDPTWASPQAQDIYFKDFTLVVRETF